MKKIFTSIALMLAAAISNAQTTATNFTATDCNGNSHTLFSELDSGKIIVLAWVMPCGMCVTGGDAAYNAVQTFATSNPGKVRYYLIDDAGNTSCSSLTSWATSNGIPSPTAIFGNSGNIINESNYGGSGMPHIVVVGGTNHKIYFNEKSGSGSGTQAAIQSAINAVGVKEVTNQITFSISPNPATNTFEVNYGKTISKIAILNISGQAVDEEVYTNGSVNPTVDLSKIAKGIYTVRVTDVDGNIGTQKLVKE